jgi:hypothetical protein
MRRSAWNLYNDDLKRECEQRFAKQYPDSPPFASPAHWAAFIATGLSYPLPPGAGKSAS